MPEKYDDAQFYRFHEKDSPERCFLCARDTGWLLIFRHIETKLLVHLCRDCVYEHIGDYMLDNTRPWHSEKG